MGVSIISRNVVILVSTMIAAGLGAQNRKAVWKFLLVLFLKKRLFHSGLYSQGNAPAYRLVIGSPPRVTPPHPTSAGAAQRGQPKIIID